MYNIQDDDEMKASDWRNQNTMVLHKKKTDAANSVAKSRIVIDRSHIT